MGRKHRHKYQEAKPMLRQKVRIQTSLGEAELTPDATVQVYIDGKNSVLKEVKDLQKGDRVLFRRDRITSTINDVNPLLEENPFYRHARSQIFHRYASEEDKVTMLRKLILEGLVNHGYLDAGEETQRKIEMSGADLSKDEMWMARTGLEEMLRTDSPDQEMPSETTYSNWLRNVSVLAIKRYLTRLSQINPELADFSEEDGDRKQAYEFWKTCRQQVMKGLHKGGGEQNGKEKKERGGEERTHRVVVEDIVNQIVQSYDEQTAIAQVVSKEQIAPNREPDESSAIVLRGKEEPLGFIEFCKDLTILENYAHLAMEKSLANLGVNSQMRICYLFDIASEISKNSARAKEMNEALQRSIKDQTILGYENLGMRASEESIQEAIKKYTPEEAIKKALIRDIFEGKIDDSLGIPDGSVRKLLIVYSALVRQKPIEFLQLQTAESELNSQIGNSMTDKYDPDVVALESNMERGVKEFLKFKKAVEKKHGCSLEEVYKEKMVWFATREYQIYHEPILAIRGIEDIRESDPEDLKKQLRKKAEVQEFTFFKRSKVESTLRRYGLEKIMDIDPYLDLFESEEKQKTDSSSYKPHAKNPEWVQKAGKGHDALVDRLIESPELIEQGLEVIDSEYTFGEGWARADILYQDSKGNPLVVEVKQYAERNGDGFNNALKAVEQTTGYRSAIEARLNYCPLTRDKNIPVRGMLVAYQIDNDAKAALEKAGCEYKEIAKPEESEQEAA